ncbi:MAG: tRNA 4-thiouridine(8) synthase ThiI [Firmicutes bacterium]|nr:tRNA 4-thiouridine(8) synthase ThiI [Bacillota bacterium]
MDKNCYIVRVGEVALKGLNKPYFERVLMQRIAKALKKYPDCEVSRVEGILFVRAPKELPEETVVREVSKVFGVETISPAVETESDLDAIGEAAVAFMKHVIETRGVKTFKVEARRSDKNFPIESPEIARRVGAAVLKGCKVLKVDVHEPDVKLFVHVRRDHSYLYDQKIDAFGGLPLGTNGKGLVLLSGGIDSPVAAWMMAKRGMVIEAVHFHSYPYTSERAFEKVKDLAKILAGYMGRIRIHSVNLLPIQEEIVANCPEDETTIHVRRFMMKIAEEIAKKNRCMMLITGENIGQVASQTAEALVVTDNAVSLPVMRPLIALDKTDIIEIAQEIGTFETSIQPFEDCCTVFLPKHPKTKPKLESILESESKLDVDGLVAAAVASEEITTVNPAE